MSFHREMYEKGRLRHDFNVKMCKLVHKYTRYKVEINGIPEEYDEDLTNIISRISKIISYEIQEKNIIDARRIRTRYPRPVTAQLRSNKVRKHFLRALTRYNEVHKDDKLNSTDLGFSGDPIPIFMSMHPSRVNKYQRRETRWNAREQCHSFAVLPQTKICTESDYEAEDDDEGEVDEREWMVEDELEAAQDFQALRLGGWHDAEEGNAEERDGEWEDDEQENEVVRLGDWENVDEENEVEREDADEENDVEREDAEEEHEVESDDAEEENDVEREDVEEEVESEDTEGDNDIEREDAEEDNEAESEDSEEEDEVESEDTEGEDEVESEEADEENEMEDGKANTKVERVADGKAVTEVERVADGKAKIEVEKVEEREDGDENNDEKFVRESEAGKVVKKE